MLGSRDKSTKKTIAIILVLNLLLVSFLGCVKLGSNPVPTSTPTLTPTKKSTTTPIPTPVTTPIPTISDELTLELKNLPELDWALNRIYKPSVFVEVRDYIRMTLDIYKSNPRMSNRSGEPLLYAILWLGIRYLLQFTNSAVPWLDAFTTATAIVGTLLLTRKVLDNWLFFIVSDFVSIALYAYKELYLFAVLFFVYTILAIFGYYKWKQDINK